MNWKFIKMMLIVLGFFYLSWGVYQYRNNDQVFYSGLVALAIYLFLAVKMVENYVDYSEEEDSEMEED